MESMLVLKEFYEKFSSLINEIGILSTQMNDTAVEWGGQERGLRYTFTKDEGFYSIKLIDDIHYTFELEAICYNFQHININSTCTFFTSPQCNEIYTGKGFSTTKFNIVHRDESEFRRDMNYPIVEEEYFQNSTRMKLEDEEFYQYFMELEPLSLELGLKFSHVEDGEKLALSLLKDTALINSIINKLNILLMTCQRIP
ncbi:hypothetical protein [Yersinia phage fHe-Yen9-04]|uniref:Uncharacterized protein n=2 Tax=Eneladusvirus Yen904 TaxID=2560849 RepID=A0A2C9CWM5_9CAUD|nr:hypothetical protein FDJ41_gp032 [Yersinia phage fHe-Yen9-04]SOK58309.1 hypothetical protein [Yersinia phage fHe-Yen9-04]SOK58847.1 hypothetical protein [Yersinia phage fHe-Yen9-03]VUE36078.1 hypothetical protein [Yersinia phage fHe-Yen9-04]